MELLINQLIDFALEKQMIYHDDIDYSVNLLLDLFHIDHFTRYDFLEKIDDCSQILEKMLDYAVAQGIIDDTVTARDLFDTRIMNCVMPRPHEVVQTFRKKYQISPSTATDYYYNLSIASNYIRKNRTDKNIRFKAYYRYGNFEITINLSKPEKDPKEIAKAKSVKSSGYPQCLLCKENVGFSGDLNRAARQTHRIIPISLNGEDYFLQYSPYVYYDQHCIVFNKEHKPMIIQKATFEHLLSFIEIFPHYMLGSNADLPIVGGSILSHDHFQGGCYEFPMEQAEVLESITSEKYPSLKIEILKWPLSTVRVTSDHKGEMIDFADHLLQSWKEYSLPELDILSHTGSTPHNTITPIARMKNGYYQLDLVLRNNRTNEKYPDGIFHPHQDLHHIKKENIGLIEVMGLAILPARLKDEIHLLKECLLKEKNMNDYPSLTKHLSWYQELHNQYQFTADNIDQILKKEFTIRFVRVLEDAGVFKMDEQGILAFKNFIKSLV